MDRHEVEFGRSRRRVLTAEEFDALLKLRRDPEYVAGLPCPCGMVEVDNPVRREVRHRRSCNRAGGAA
jgi:hypothetical protein